MDLSLVQPRVRPLGEMVPLAVNLPCDLHSHARDLFPLYQEQHHIIPQDWQDEFRPAQNVRTPWAVGGVLWDNRTINVCRTGHGNIHFLLVLFMKERERLGPAMIDDDVGVDRIRINIVGRLRDQGKRVSSADAFWAMSAMIRWVTYGLSLMDLCNNHSYGRI